MARQLLQKASLTILQQIEKNTSLTPTLLNQAWLVNAWRILQRSENIIDGRSMNKYIKTEFLSCLASIDWMQVVSDLNFDPNRMTDAFHEIFETTLSSHALIRKRKVRAEQTPWCSPNIKALMRERDKTNS